MRKIYKVVSLIPTKSPKPNTYDDYAHNVLGNHIRYAITDETGNIIEDLDGHGFFWQSTTYDFIDREFHGGKEREKRLSDAISNWLKTPLHRNAIEKFHIEWEWLYGLKQSLCHPLNKNLTNDDFKKIWVKVEAEFKIKIPKFIRIYYEDGKND